MKHEIGHLRQQTARRVYTFCSFDCGLVVPRVQLIDANTDDEAVACARGRNLGNRREVWDGYRLVAIIQPRNPEAA